MQSMCRSTHLRKKHNSVPPYKGSIRWAETFSIKLPATELDNESDSELGELEKVRETKFVRDVDAATREVTSTGKKAQEVNGR